MSKLTSTVKTQSVMQETTYPCLMVADSGVVVLFDAPGRGTIVGRPNKCNIGHISHHWDMSDFKPFHGIIELTQG